MIEIFKSERFGSVRTLMQGGEPWFCLADICRVLELSNTTMVRGTLETDEVQLFDLHALNQSEGVSINGLGNGKTTFVSEGGLYQIIIRSDKPQAKPFRKWVTSEVLPSIRKHGAYATDKVIDSILNNPDYGIRLLETLKAERAKRMEAERRFTQTGRKFLIELHTQRRTA